MRALAASFALVKKVILCLLLLFLYFEKEQNFRKLFQSELYHTSKTVKKSVWTSFISLHPKVDSPSVSLIWQFDGKYDNIWKFIDNYLNQQKRSWSIIYSCVHLFVCSRYDGLILWIIYVVHLGYVWYRAASTTKFTTPQILTLFSFFFFPRR